jgi:Na+-driven multidrug efflux pump
MAIWALFIDTIFFPLVGFQIVAGSYFQSSGQPLKAAIIELLRQVIFLGPLYVLLPMIASWFAQQPVTMIIVAIPVSDILSVLVTTALIIVEVRTLKKLIVER